METANPKKVLLFGSYAMGDATPDSDLDIMVIVHDSTPDIRDLARRLHLKISSVIAPPSPVYPPCIPRVTLGTTLTRHAIWQYLKGDS